MSEQIALAIEYLNEYGPGLDAYVAKKTIRERFKLSMTIAEKEYRNWRRSYNKPKLSIEELEKVNEDTKIKDFLYRCSFKCTTKQVLDIKKYRELGWINRKEIGDKVGLEPIEVERVISFFKRAGIHTFRSKEN